MTLQWSYLFLFFIVGIGVNTVSLLSTWQRRNRPGVFEFSVAFFCLGLWNLFALIRGAVVNMALQNWLGNGIQALSAFLAASFLLAILGFNATTLGSNKRFRQVVWVFASVVALFALANPWHYLITTPAEFGTFMGLTLPFRGLGELYWVAYIAPVYSALLYALWALALTVRRIRKSISYSLLVWAGAAAPIVFNAITIARIFDFLSPVLDLTPVITTFTAVIAIWALFQVRFIDVFDGANKRLIDLMPNGLLVIDRKDRVLQANQVAQQLLGETVTIGTNLNTTVLRPALATIDSVLTLDEKTVELQITPIENSLREDRLVTITDISQQVAQSQYLDLQLENFELLTQFSQTALQTQNEADLVSTLRRVLESGFDATHAEVLIAQPYFAIAQPPQSVRLKSSDYSMVVVDPSSPDSCLSTDNITLEEAVSRPGLVLAKRLSTESQVVGAVQLYGIEHLCDLKRDLLGRITQISAEVLEKIWAEQRQIQARAASEALQQASQSLTTAKTMDGVLEDILGFMGTAIEFNFGAIALVSNEGVEIVALRGETELDIQELHYIPDDNCIIDIALNQRNVLSVRTEEEDRVYSLLNQQVTGNWLVAPLEADGRHFGALLINNRIHRIFWGPDVQVLRAMSRQATLAILNAQNLDASNLLRSRLRKILQLNTALRDISTVDGALSTGLQTSAEILEADSAYLWQRFAQSEWQLNATIGDEIAAASQALSIAVKAGHSIVRDSLVSETQRCLLVPLSLINDSQVVMQLEIDEKRFSPAQLQSLDEIAQIVTNAVATISTREVLEGEVAKRTLELEDVNQKLQADDALKSRFVSDMSHDLRTPLTNLKLWMGMLSKSPEQKIPRITKILDKQITVLDELVQSVHTIAELDLKELRTMPSAFDFNTLVQAQIDQHRSAAEQKGLRLQFESDYRLPSITGIPALLNKVVNQLLENAINYTSAGSVNVRTTFDAANDCVALHIVDTGLGISEAEQQHIFDRFYRGDNAAQSDIIGTGLGLSIVKEVVEQHEGRIFIDSIEQQGTTITVELPLVSQKVSV